MDNPKTIFEKIIDREIPAEIIHEDELSIAFKDINPVAPIHFLIVPKKRIKNIHFLDGEEDAKIIAHLFLMIQKLATEQNIAEQGYRVITNIGEFGGQTVDHLHLHIIGGRALKWPPG